MCYIEFPDFLCENVSSLVSNSKQQRQRQQQNRQNKHWQINNQSRPKAEGNYGSSDKFTQSLGPSVSVEILWAWQNQRQEAHAVGEFSPRFLPSTGGGAFALPLTPSIGTSRARLLTCLLQLWKCVHFSAQPSK